MEKKWKEIGQRIVLGLGVQAGELVNLRDSSGNLDLLLETSLAIERVGACPYVQHISSDYLERLLAEVPLNHLIHRDKYHLEWMKQVDRVLVLGGARPDFSIVPREAVKAWDQAHYQVNLIEETRRLPYLLVAVPTPKGAQQLGLSHGELEETLMPALSVSVEELQGEIGRVLDKAHPSRTITIHSGGDHHLYLEHGDRLWLRDDGTINEEDQEQGAIVSNLPAGSIYTTVLEDKTQGSLWLPRAGEAEEVVFHFTDGRIVNLQAKRGADLLSRELDSHSGEPRRISHIGIGLNPHLHHPIGWTLVDEHVHGALFVALGENRYMGGQNQSSLNVDFALWDATLEVDDRTILSKGQVVV